MEHMYLLVRTFDEDLGELQLREVDQELFTPSLHTNCTLELTLSLISSIFNCDICRSSLISCKKHADVHITSQGNIKFSLLSAIIETLLCGLCVMCNNREPQLYYDSLLYKHLQKSPWEVLLKIKRYGTGLNQRIW